MLRRSVTTSQKPAEVVRMGCQGVEAEHAGKEMGGDGTRAGIDTLLGRTPTE